MKFLHKSFVDIVLAALSILLMVGCSATHYVVPVKKGEHRITANLGGPLIKYSGLIIPVPLTGVGYAYGVTDNLTAYGNLHTTAMAFGVIQADAGALKNIIQQNHGQPGVSVNGTANFMFDKWKSEFRFYPELNVNAYWHNKNKNRFAYTGLSSWFELQSKGANDRAQTTHFIPSLFAGHCFSRLKMDYTVEVRWIAPFTYNKDIVANYVGAGNNGAFGFYFTASKKF